MNKKLIEKEWVEFSKCIHEDASAMQKVAMRDSFYAGAMSLHMIVLTNLEGGDEPTERDSDTIEGVDAEMREYAQSVLARGMN